MQHQDILRLLREIEVHREGGMDVISACRGAGISDRHIMKKTIGPTNVTTATASNNSR
jgi:hypothetical protein